MSANRRDSRKNTSSGHGAAGMGGDPGDDPRDQNSGGGKRVDEERDIRTRSVPGASGTGKEKKTGSPGS
jgi:hypothetical protein